MISVRRSEKDSLKQPPYSSHSLERSKISQMNSKNSKDETYTI